VVAVAQAEKVEDFLVGVVLSMVHLEAETLF
jgi:hypothetical protein